MPTSAGHGMLQRLNWQMVIVALGPRRLWTCRFACSKAWTTQERCPHAHGRSRRHSPELHDRIWKDSERLGVYVKNEFKRSRSAGPSFSSHGRDSTYHTGKTVQTNRATSSYQRWIFFETPSYAFATLKPKYQFIYISVNSHLKNCIMYLISLFSPL